MDIFVDVLTIEHQQESSVEKDSKTGETNTDNFDALHDRHALQIVSIDPSSPNLPGDANQKTSQENRVKFLPRRTNLEINFQIIETKIDTVLPFFF